LHEKIPVAFAVSFTHNIITDFTTYMKRKDNYRHLKVALVFKENNDVVVRLQFHFS
jgi:hypothetical protein